MPSLQLHQLRVAAVGKLICENFSKSVNKEDVILACLFHDMGNIVKSDLSYFPDFTKPEGIEYWESVKSDFIKKYGGEQHSTNAAIMREVGLPLSIIELLNGAGFSRIESVVASKSFELKLLQYADMRVGPHGVLSLDERLAEGRERYIVRKKDYYDTHEGFEKLLSSAHKLEEQIFEHAAIKPEDINDTMVAPLIEELWEYPVA